MTTSDLVKYYANLLILEYLGKPKAYATIETIIEPAIMDQLPVVIQDGFNIDTAVGVQLDIAGKYAGVTRYGFDFSGAITLNDDDFRVLIKMVIIENTTGSSLYDIQKFFNVFFPGSFQVFDYKNMHMSYFLDSSVISNQLAQLFVKQHRLPKPMGVQLGALVYAPTINNFFGYVTYDNAVPYNSVGFGSYGSYVTTNPWLSYVNAVVE